MRAPDERVRTQAGSKRVTAAMTVCRFGRRILDATLACSRTAWVDLAHASVVELSEPRGRRWPLSCFGPARRRR